MGGEGGRDGGGRERKKGSEIHSWARLAAVCRCVPCHLALFPGRLFSWPGNEAASHHADMMKMMRMRAMKETETTLTITAEAGSESPAVHGGREGGRVRRNNGS